MNIGHRGHAAMGTGRPGNPAPKPDHPAETATALAPVRDRLLEEAAADAQALLTAAAEDAASLLRDAEARAAGILAEARSQGAADAETARRAVHAQARRAARARELAARRECWEELRRQVVEGVEALRDTDAYPHLRERLAARVRQLLGPDALVTEAPGGGIVGEAPGRRLDLSLATLAERALERTGAEVEQLWAP
ncbi:V-type ATP synthase subunit E family protein [Streptomyces sp. S.PB5]|uniref:V-type ATP synthase subunit E family protein n=1 Tax=Streptomyces sp. S.PB5 TaxID=3020844 RepID=UPI0025B24603|nr:V-type ATP synthase subunit E family protein [Streptomyces sp. S.PB5]MDN3027950.1 V-type ATP synthase subunit E family protein [Streptomyces sp. S.PB5]